jgi:hypothetical protein
MAVAGSSQERIARSRIAKSATAVLVGIVLSTAVDPSIGGWVTVGSVGMLIWSLHRFGRTGPS